jgi:phosphatidylinositol glycan class C protein
MLSPTDDDESETPFPTLDHQPTFSSLLSPDDAFVPPLSRGYGGDSAAESTHSRLRRVNDRGGSRRRKRAWKKLMWVKQSCSYSEKTYRLVEESAEANQLDL